MPAPTIAPSTRHRGVAAALAAIALLCAILGAATAGTALCEGSRPSIRAAAAAPIVLAAGASAWAYRLAVRVRALRRAADDRPDVSDPPDARPLSDEIAFERAASVDLLAIDRTVRAYYRLPASGHDPSPASGAARLFTQTACLELRGTDPRCQPHHHACDATEFLADLRLAGATSTTERARTVHVVGNTAIVISSFEAHSPATVARGVNILQLRRAGGAWLIHAVHAEPVDAVVTERSANRRPVSA